MTNKCLEEYEVYLKELKDPKVKTSKMYLLRKVEKLNESVREREEEIREMEE